MRPWCIHSGTTDFDGYSPAATVISVNGRLYGTTPGGGLDRGGTVYSVDPSTGAEKVLYTFPGAPEGWGPNDPVIDIGGMFYGTTISGGLYNWGTVFSFDRKTRKEKVLHSFDDNGTDGALPYMALLQFKNKFYGTTSVGGSSTSCGSYGCGTVFELKP